MFLNLYSLSFLGKYREVIVAIVEGNGRFPFLDVLVTKKADNTLDHQIYRKPTHTDRYLHAKSHDHPIQKQSAINSLVYRALTISDKEHLQTELNHLKLTLQQNGHDKKDINKIINKHINKRARRISIT